MVAVIHLNHFTASFSKSHKIQIYLKLLKGFSVRNPRPESLWKFHARMGPPFVGGELCEFPSPPEIAESSCTQRTDPARWKETGIPNLLPVSGE
jgi:hypothetical protein